MNLQQHERIAQIKKLSGYMHTALWCLVYLILLLWLIVAITILVSDKLTLTLGKTPISLEEMTYIHRFAALLIVSVVALLCIKIARHFRDLMHYFRRGEIFNRAAIAHARKAIFNALLLWGMTLTVELSHWLYALIKIFLRDDGGVVNVNFALDGSIFLGLIFFGLMYLLLWALEIGRDLNEESELTI
jgi:hypothetical protein